MDKEYGIIKNNFISLALHIAISAIMILIYKPFSLSSRMYSTGIAGNVVMLIVVLFLYTLTSYLLAGNLLSVSGSCKNRVISVLSTSTVLLAVWIFCYILDDGGFMSGLVWAFFMYCSLSFIPVYSSIEFLHIPVAFLTAIVVVLPSLLSWIGIEVRYNMKKVSHSKKGGHE